MKQRDNKKERESDHKSKVRILQRTKRKEDKHKNWKNNQNED